MKLLAVPGYFRDSAFNFNLQPELENREALPFLQYAGGFVQRGCKFHPAQPSFRAMRVSRLGFLSPLKRVTTKTYFARGF